MNLADIRRKAQAAEAQSQQAPPAAQATAVGIEALWQAVAGSPLNPVLDARPAAPAQPPAFEEDYPEPDPAQVSPDPERPEPPLWQPPPEWEPRRPEPQSEPYRDLPAPELSRSAPEPEAPRSAAAPVQEPELLDDLGAPEDWQEPVTLSYPGLSHPEVPQFFSPPAEAPEPTGFDPAALILRGRESAQGDEEFLEAEAAEETLELLCFKVATEEYAISIMDIKEIIKPREVTEVPRVPEFVRGILSLRGIIIPIFDMRLRLGLPEGERSERERIIVVKRLGGFCGILVDQVVQVVRIAEESVEAAPVVLEGIDRDFVQGIGRVSGRMLILLDMEKVLDVGLL
ncbi:hypothetical protein GMST_40860 [Geomonas silvestris]|uniref:CheW-like domain-containing protein n=1 Tax=Geomonas silvestris TaxID=2740184 RepID=A0A6V8MP38_9BACT|nr:chemotaxis protein CheW [Geomonas silvestris]GFO61761.1 hypothetical protein GMST_40860 [Geomonas silvestris]